MADDLLTHRPDETATPLAYRGGFYFWFTPPDFRAG